MKKVLKLISVAAAASAAILVASCSGSSARTYSPQDVATAAKELRTLIPAIQSGLALAKPDTPTSRALTPSSIVGWPYGTQDPGQVYTAAGGVSPATVRLPATGYYTMSNGDQIYFTLTPETTLGSTYYHVVLYTYPAVDMSVAYTIEEYIVNTAATAPGWAWGNMDTSGNLNAWVSLTTAYSDGSTGARTVTWSSAATATFYPAFTVGEPDPANGASFTGYRYEESGTPPAAAAGSGTYSSAVTEHVTGKGAATDSTQYYTETTATQHSGLTYVVVDVKKKWGVDTHIVTRMQEDTSAHTRMIRSVGEVGTSQYYIDKVDISGGVTTPIVYTSTHEIYDSALPRGVNALAESGVSMALTEDGAGRGTFTGTMEQVDGSERVRRDVTVKRDSLYRFTVTIKYNSTVSRSLAETIQIPLTRQDLSNLSLAVPAVEGTFTGYYEAGNLFGTISTPSGDFDVAIADQGVAVDGVLLVK